MSKKFEIGTSLNKDLNDRIEHNMSQFVSMYGLNKKSAFLTIALSNFCTYLEREKTKDSIA